MSKENLSESSSIVTNSNCARSKLERKRVIMLERHTGWWYGTEFYCYRAKIYYSSLAVAFPNILASDAREDFSVFSAKETISLPSSRFYAHLERVSYLTCAHVWPFLKYAAPNLFWFLKLKNFLVFPSSVQSFFLHLPRGAWTPSGCSYITFLRLIRIFDIYFFKIDSQI